MAGFKDCLGRWVKLGQKDCILLPITGHIRPRYITSCSSVGSVCITDMQTGHARRSWLEHNKAGL